MRDMNRWLGEMFEQAVQHHTAGRLVEAEGLYRRILEVFPCQGSVHHHLGLLALGRGDGAAALPHLQRAVEAEPANHQFRAVLVQTLLNADRPYEARPLLEAGMQRFGLAGRDALELTVNLHAACQRAAPEPRLPVPLADVQDPDFDAVLEQAWPFSMSSLYGLVDAFHSLYQAVRHAVRYRIPGDFVECGVYAGGMSLLAALTFLRLGDTSRHLYLYDTYEGMPPPTAEDSEAARQAYEANTKDGKKWAAKGLEEVRAVLSQSGYPAEKIHFVKGMVEDTIPARAPETIAILRLDTDFYTSTLHELTHLYPRLSRGGSLIIDDYGYMPGARQAVDEYFDSPDRPMLLNRINYTVRVGTKP